MNTNFVAIGRITGECIFIHKEDVEYLKRYGYSTKIKCIAIDFKEKKVSKPVIIYSLLKFCPHTPVESEGERSVINDLILSYFSNSEISMLNNKFERIKYSKHQNGRGSEHQP